MKSRKYKECDSKCLTAADKRKFRMAGPTVATLVTASLKKLRWRPTLTLHIYIYIYIYIHIYIAKVAPIAMVVPYLYSIAKVEHIAKGRPTLTVKVKVAAHFPHGYNGVTFLYS
eukprot:1370969-Amorphochlora_amoeboformis.AAC.1